MIWWKLAILFRDGDRKPFLIIPIITLMIYGLRQERLSVHPDRGIVRTDRLSDDLSTRPDKLNTLIHQSPSTDDSLREPLHYPVTWNPSHTRPVSTHTFLASLLQTGLPWALRCCIKSPPINASGIRHGHCYQNQLFWDVHQLLQMIWWKLAILFRDGDRKPFLIIPIITLMIYGLRQERLSVHPDRGIVRTDRLSDDLSTRPDKLNTLIHQSPSTDDSLREPLHYPVTWNPSHTRPVSTHTFLASLLQTGLPWALRCCIKSPPINASGIRHGHCYQNQLFWDVHQLFLFLLTCSDLIWLTGSDLIWLIVSDLIWLIVFIELIQLTVLTWFNSHFLLDLTQFKKKD